MKTFQLFGKIARKNRILYRYCPPAGVMRVQSRLTPENQEKQQDYIQLFTARKQLLRYKRAIGSVILPIKSWFKM